MTEEKWQQIKEIIKKKFKVLSEDKTKEENKEIETIEFQGPLGKMKLEWIQKPKVLDIRTSHAAKRAGAAAGKVEQVLSEKEKVSYLKAYVFKDENWVVIEPDKMLGST